MRNRCALLVAALMLFATGSAFAANLGSGVIITMGGASTYDVQFGDTVRFAYLTPGEDQQYCGKTYSKGGKYPIFLLDSSRTEGVEATIVWEPAAGTDLSEFPYGERLEVNGLAPTPKYSNSVQACDTVTLQWQAGSGGGKNVTINMFRDRSTTGLFSFDTK